MRKIEQDYPEEGARRVVDVLGATLLYKDRAAVENAVNLVWEFAEKNGGKVARVKDRFKNPSMGYKDFLLNIKMPNRFVTDQEI